MYEVLRVFEESFCQQAARELSQGGRVSVFLKAGHLDDEELVDIFGGKAEADGSYTPPENFTTSGVLTIKMHSGHSFRVFNARLTKTTFQNGLNMQGVLGFGIRVDMLKPTDGKGRRWRSYPPGVEPDTSDSTADADSE